MSDEIEIQDQPITGELVEFNGKDLMKLGNRMFDDIRESRASRDNIFNKTFWAGTLITFALVGFSMVLIFQGDKCFGGGLLSTIIGVGLGFLGGRIGK